MRCLVGFGVKPDESLRKCIGPCGRWLPLSDFKPLSKADPGERDVPGHTCRQCWAEYERQRAEELPYWLEKWHQDRERELENDRLEETGEKPRAKGAKRSQI